MGDLELKFSNIPSNSAEIQAQTRELLDLLGMHREKYRNFLYLFEKSANLPEKSQKTANIEEIPLDLSSPEQKTAQNLEKSNPQIFLQELPFLKKPSP